MERRFSRRQLGRFAGVLTAGAAVPMFSEFALARQAEKMLVGGGQTSSDLVRINSNENPLGPCREGLEAIARIGRYGGRYSPFDDEIAFQQTVAESEDIDPKYIAVYAGSSDPLFRLTCAFTSPSQSWVMADPGYGGGAPEFVGSKLVRVPLRADHSHDVAAMLRLAPEAGAYYICNPNNPSGTLTSQRDIEFLTAHKPKGSVVVVDEAYTHFTASPQSAKDLVRREKDVIILRTFSKVYGMAGLRAGFVMARPDLLEKLNQFGDTTLPITGLACATASLRMKNLVAERRAINRQIRESTFEFLERKRVRYIPSETNFFMMDVGRPWAEFARPMAAQKVLVGRLWPSWPTKVRVTVGTREDMQKFQSAFERVMA